MEKFITKEMVIKGYNQHLINLILSPNGDGIACQIGDNWFYFGGSTAEEYNNVAEYKEIMLTSDIIKEIYDVLCELKTEFADEYLYYYYYLMENLKADKPENKKLKIKLSDGRELVAEVNELDADNIEMAVYVLDSTDKQNLIYQDICLVREGVKNDIECLVWGNKDEEDYTDFFSIGKYESEE